MNRVIKFRFWDATTRQFYKPAGAQLNGAGEFYTLRVGNKSLGLDRLIVNQFTGIVDKHGIDIYEHDIVRYIGPNGKEVITNRKVVEWFLSGFNIRSGDNFEVVGNIYENPEAMK